MMLITPCASAAIASPRVADLISLGETCHRVNFPSTSTPIALANLGVSADVRMKLVGHQSIDVHQRYTHVELAPLQAAIAALPRLEPLGS
jgi:hypothetical protein